MMKKLEDIPKKDIFEAPEGYFEALPAKIRSRIDSEADIEKIWVKKPQFKVAMAAVIVVLLSFFATLQFYRSQINVQEQLSLISDEELIDYLGSSEISLLEITSEISADDQVFEKLLQDNLQFEADEFEDEILMNLEKYTDEIL